MQETIKKGGVEGFVTTSAGFSPSEDTTMQETIENGGVEGFVTVPAWFHPSSSFGNNFPDAIFDIPDPPFLNCSACDEKALKKGYSFLTDSSFGPSGALLLSDALLLCPKCREKVQNNLLSPEASKKILEIVGKTIKPFTSIDGYILETIWNPNQHDLNSF